MGLKDLVISSDYRDLSIVGTDSITIMGFSVDVSSAADGNVKLSYSTPTLVPNNLYRENDYSYINMNAIAMEKTYIAKMISGIDNISTECSWNLGETGNLEYMARNNSRSSRVLESRHSVIGPYLPNWKVKPSTRVTKTDMCRAGMCIPSSYTSQKSAFTPSRYSKYKEIRKMHNILAQLIKGHADETRQLHNRKAIKCEIPFTGAGSCESCLNLDLGRYPCQNNASGTSHQVPSHYASSNTKISSGKSTITNQSQNKKRSHENRHNEQGQEDDDDEDDGEKEPKRSRKGRPSSVGDEQDSSFACPFRKHDPRKYSVQNSKWKICALTSHQNVARVK